MRSATAKIIPFKRSKAQPRWIAQDPTLELANDIVAESGMKPAEIAARCGVTTQTIRNWANHKVRRPQNMTLRFVARACGWDQQWVNLKSGEIRSAPMPKGTNR